MNEIAADQLEAIRASVAALNMPTKDGETVTDLVQRLVAIVAAVGPLRDAAMRLHQANICAAPETFTADQEAITAAMDDLGDAVAVYELAARGSMDLAAVQRELRDQLREARADLDHWKRVATDPTIEILEHEREIAPLGMRHPLNRAIVATFAGLLGDAPNFVTMTADHPDHGELRITVRRGTGKDPEVLCQEYRARLEAMGVTDLAPLPPARSQELVEEPSSPIENGSHIMICQRPASIRCERCGGSEPLSGPMPGPIWRERIRKFKAAHDACKAAP